MGAGHRHRAGNEEPRNGGRCSARAWHDLARCAQPHAGRAAPAPCTKMMEGNPESAPAAIASTLTCIGRYYRMQNKLALAEDALTRALDLERKAFGENHPQVAYIMERLAEI